MKRLQNVVAYAVVLFSLLPMALYCQEDFSVSLARKIGLHVAAISCCGAAVAFTCDLIKDIKRENSFKVFLQPDGSAIAPLLGWGATLLSLELICQQKQLEKLAQEKEGSKKGQRETY